MSTASDNEKYIEEWERKYGLPYHMKDTVDNALGNRGFWSHVMTGKSPQEKRRKADKCTERIYGKDMLNRIRKAHPEEF